MIEQSQKEVEEAMRVDPAQWAHNYLCALAVIKELEERLLNRLPMKGEIH